MIPESISSIDSSPRTSRRLTVVPNLGKWFDLEVTLTVTLTLCRYRFEWPVICPRIRSRYRHTSPRVRTADPAKAALHAETKRSHRSDENHSDWLACWGKPLRNRPNWIKFETGPIGSSAFNPYPDALLHRIVRWLSNTKWTMRPSISPSTILTGSCPKWRFSAESCNWSEQQQCSLLGKIVR